MKPTQEWADAVRSGKLAGPTFVASEVITPPQTEVKPMETKYQTPWYIWSILVVMAGLIIYLFISGNKVEKVKPAVELTAQKAVSVIMDGVCRSKIQILRENINRFYSEPQQVGLVKRSLKIHWTGLCPKSYWQNEFGKASIEHNRDFTIKATKH